MKLVAFAATASLLLAACSVSITRDHDNKRIAQHVFEEVIGTGSVERASEFYHPSFVNHRLTRGSDPGGDRETR
jgi:hypothetical protein